MAKILEEVEVAVLIADDIIVHGCIEEHGSCLYHPIQSACKYGLVFNADKCDLKGESVVFFDCLYDCNGVCLDPAKENGIAKMPGPTSFKETNEFLGMTTYLDNVIPKIFYFLHLSGADQKKDVMSTWKTTLQSKLDSIKFVIFSVTTL